MGQVLSIRAARRPTRRTQIDPLLLTLGALALVILAVEAAVIVWGAPALDPTVPLYTS